MISIKDARRSINSFRDGALKAKPNAFEPTDEQLKIQAERARDLARLLKKEKIAILADPTGTGKTAMALAAAYCLLQDGAIESIVVVAPNNDTLDRWKDRARWAGLKNQHAVSKKRRQVSQIYRKNRISFTSAYLLRKAKFPTAKDSNVAAKKVLFIIDEAHRGFGNDRSKSFEEIERIARGACVLSVTATPVQMDSDDLTSLLRINSHVDTDQLADIKQFAMSVTKVLENPDHALAESVVEDMGRANRVLKRFMLDPNPTVIPKPIFNPTTVKLDIDSIRVFHVLRMLAGLKKGTGGDRYYQAITSSWAAVRASSVWKELESDPNMYELFDELNSHMESRPHPKVQNTVDWIKQKIQKPQTKPRNVLVFTWSTQTQPELADLLRKQLGSDAEVPDLTKKLSVRDQKRFQGAPSNGESLILVARNNMSESIDLDGGDPCLVHHDLDWNPVRMKQRVGRVIRISSGFEAIPKSDIYFPSLELPDPDRLVHTLEKRIKFADALEKRDPDALRRLLD